jgi:hypothetical protein
MRLWWRAIINISGLELNRNIFKNLTGSTFAGFLGMISLGFSNLVYALAGFYGVASSIGHDGNNSYAISN